VAFEDGGIQRRPREKDTKAAREARSLRVGPSIEQCRHDLGVPGVGGGVQRRLRAKQAQAKRITWSSKSQSVRKGKQIS
tara:strand:+ start:619 stop:855 length:237 start_codon:yes stop_codon:yes gene_type:complete